MSENNSSEKDSKKELRFELTRRLTEMARWMILEGIIDPKNGTTFQIWQHNIKDSRFNPETGDLDGPKKFVAGFGIPDPVETGFNEIAVRTILEEGGEQDG